jgi:penicillin-binding protein-related factor A (putative recombinase)
MKELYIQTQLLKKLRQLPSSFWFKIHDTITCGIPDILGVYKGRFVAIECKQKGLKPTILQAQILCELERSGGIIFVVDSSEKAQEVIKALQIKVK